VEARGNEEEAGVQTAIATVSLSGTLNEKLEAIAKAQFRGVEMFENDLLSFNGTPAEIRRMIEDLGLRTITFQPFRDFEGMPEPQRAKVFARAERKFDVMKELGCDRWPRRASAAATPARLEPRPPRSRAGRPA